jgi:hypothetical protein
MEMLERPLLRLTEQNLGGDTTMKRTVLHTIAVLLLASSLFAQSSYTFTSIDYPGAILTRAFDINDAGVIVGVFRLPGGSNSGFLFRNGKFTELPLPDPDAAFETARGMNNRGDVVGFFALNADGSEHGFLFSRETMSRLDFPGASLTDAWGINNRDNVVGSFVDGSGITHGWLRQSNTYTQIDIPGAVNTVPFGVNDGAVIVGGFDDAVSHGFLLDQGKVMSYDVPVTGNTGTQFNRINDIGDIIGVFLDGNGAQHGFLLSGGLPGKFVQLDYPGAIQSSLWGINNAGQLAGVYTDSNGVQHGFLAQPTSSKPQ